MIERILVIADDLSGAAEIASIGVRYGLPAHIEREPSTETRPGITIIDTDSRLLSPDDAASTLRRAVGHLRASDFDLIYKKVDSVMRGPVLAEIETLMETFDRSASLLIAQNPSRGRTIRDGQYEIDGVPLTHTAFANDPEYPAQSSEAIKLLGPSSRCATDCLSLGNMLPRQGITIGAASSIDDIRRWAATVGAHVMPAGSADFFRTLLEHRRHLANDAGRIGLQSGVTLFVCGSASANSASLVARARRESLPVCPMPDDLASRPEAMNHWKDSAIMAIDAADRALIVINQPLDRSPGAPHRFQTAIAEVVARVLTVRRAVNLLLEGGATASAVCRRMGWSRFDVDGELDAGICQLRLTSASAQRVIVKPGSYAWPESIWRAMASSPPPAG